jgi:hypothetical protein
VEVHAKRGIVNLIASEKFPLGELNQSTKRELGRAVISVVSAYNKASQEVAISVHENHLKGDGGIYPDADIPREPNSRDYDYYHTLGIPFADNGEMQPHYHLQFEGRSVDREMLRSVLIPLNDIGDIDGVEIISEYDIEHLASTLPEGSGVAPMIEDVIAHREKIPIEIESAEAQVYLRDSYRGEFIALSSQHTFNRANATGVEQALANMHMNSYRDPEPLLECFVTGTTTVSEALHRIEERDRFRSSSMAEQISVYRTLRDALSVVKTFPDSEESRKIAGRLSAGLIAMRNALKIAP